MTIDCCSYAFIGVEIDKEKFESLDVDKDDNIIHSIESLFRGMSIEAIWSSGEKRLFACLSHVVVEAEDESYQGLAKLERVSEARTAHIKEKLHRLLEPIHLWNEETFGHWLVINCSR